MYWRVPFWTVETTKIVANTTKLDHVSSFCGHLFIVLKEDV